uniref:Transferrin receptor-like dimerisation domain-containing protein n=1 Tax=Acrobeloides nanus TaxID=290746 RepID=A0A914CYE8_9BILA
MYAQTLLEVYVPDLRNTLDSLKTRFPQVKDGRAQVTQLIRNCQEFAKQAEVIDNEVKEILKKFSTDYLDQRRIKSINDRLVAVDRCFVNPWGMTHGPSKRHVLYSISDKDSYSAKVMPGVYDEIANIIQAENGKERNEAGKELARQISIIQISVKCATNTLLDMI